MTKIEIFQLLEEGLKELGADDYDYLYIYSDLRTIGQLRDFTKTKEFFLSRLVESLLVTESTLIVPTFSYTTSGTFFVDSTPTHLGALNSFLLNHQGSMRSEHPIFSYGALGSRSSVVKRIAKSAFGPDSLMDRLIGEKSAFLYLGRPVEFGNTSIHYIEQRHSVSYRMEKAFDTKVISDGVFVGTDYSAFVRKLDNPNNDYKFSFLASAAELRRRKIIKEIHLDAAYSNLSLLPFVSTIEVLDELLRKNQSAFLQKPLHWDVKLES